MSEEGTILGDVDSGEESSDSAVNESWPDWRKSLPEDIRAHQSLDVITDINGLAKGFVSAQTKIGAKGTIIPGPNADAETVANYRKAIGVPDDPTGYKPPTEGLPEGISIDENTQSAFFGEAHKLGLTPQQAAGLIRWQLEQAQGAQVSSEKAVEENRAATSKALRSAWGQAYDQNIGLAKAAAAKLDPTGNIVAKYGDDADVIKLLAQVGRMVADDQIIGTGGIRGAQLTPDEALAQKGELLADAEFTAAWLDGSHHGHDAAMKKMRALDAAINPEPVAT